MLAGVTAGCYVSPANRDANSSVHVRHFEMCTSFTRLTSRQVISLRILSRVTQLFAAFRIRNLAPSLYLFVYFFPQYLFVYAVFF
jgi:hypothetical protein